MEKFIQNETEEKITPSEKPEKSSKFWELSRKIKNTIMAAVASLAIGTGTIETAQAQGKPEIEAESTSTNPEIKKVTEEILRDLEGNYNSIYKLKDKITESGYNIEYQMDMSKGFDYDVSNPTPEAEALLIRQLQDKINELKEQNKEFVVVTYASSDARNRTSNPKYNEKLTKARVSQLKEIAIQAGVDENSIITMTPENYVTTIQDLLDAGKITQEDYDEMVSKGINAAGEITDISQGDESKYSGVFDNQRSLVILIVVEDKPKPLTPITTSPTPIIPLEIETPNMPTGIEVGTPLRNLTLLPPNARILLDISSSMKGQPWEQIKGVMETSIDKHKNVKFTIATFGDGLIDSSAVTVRDSRDLDRIEPNEIFNGGNMDERILQAALDLENYNGNEIIITDEPFTEANMNKVLELEAKLESQGYDLNNISVLCFWYKSMETNNGQPVYFNLNDFKIALGNSGIAENFNGQIIPIKDENGLLKIIKR